MASAPSARPFQILGLQQIAVGGLDKQKLRAFWVDLLGLRYGHTYKSEKENVDEDICETGVGAFTVEVVRPMAGLAAMAQRTSASVQAATPKVLVSRIGVSISPSSMRKPRILT